jgi:cell division protein FtsZ
MEDLISFDISEKKSSIIKVLGVGGGGSNAVNHMYIQGIKDVDFIICNTDSQALKKSPVPIRIQLGDSLTEGRGAGNKPEIGKQSAIENLNDVMDILSDNTKMIFITAGMGGGTGTGAAPVIAKAAKELGILTVAIVTIPFKFEGPRRISQALDGIAELKEHVDSLLVINNEKLREMYGDLPVSEAFAKADDVLTIAAKGIAEIITVHGHVNVDFADVETVMTNSGVAIMGSGLAEGENRAIEAIKIALSSPLLNNNDIHGAKNILLNISSGINEATMDEIGQISEYVQEAAGSKADMILGSCMDETIGNKINVTIIATGFDTKSIPELFAKTERTKITNQLYSQETSNTNKQVFELSSSKKESKPETEIPDQKKIIFDNKTVIEDPRIKQFYNSEPSKDQVKKPINSPENITSPVNNEDLSNERINKLNNIDEMENIPAYERSKIKIENVKKSTENEISKYTLSVDNKNKVKLNPDNPYLHDNVD